MKKGLILPMTALLALLCVGPVYAYQNGAPTLDCFICHAPVGDHASTLKVTGIPRQYKPEKTYKVTVVVKSDIRSHGDVQGGFVLQATGGELIVADPVHTQISNGLLTHTIEGSTLRTWEAAWKAPQKGEVEFTVMATAANGDFASIGDAVLVEVFASGSPK